MSQILSYIFCADCCGGSNGPPSEHEDTGQDNAELLEDTQEDAQQEDLEQEDPSQIDAANVEQADTANVGQADTVNVGQADAANIEQDVRDQDDPEQHVSEEVTSVVVTSPLDQAELSDRDDWPKWFVDAIDHLQIISNAEMWVTLLANFVKLERSLGFPSMVSRNIAAMCVKAD